MDIESSSKPRFQISFLKLPDFYNKLQQVAKNVEGSFFIKKKSIFSIKPNLAYFWMIAILAKSKNWQKKKKNN